MSFLTVRGLPRRTKADPIARAFGHAVRAERERRAESLEEVAGRMKPRMDPRYLGEIELGWHATTIPTAKRIADALQVPLADLVVDL